MEMAFAVGDRPNIRSPGPRDERHKINRPVLFIRADDEPMENYPAESFKENCAGPCEVVIVPNCDHFYVGAEDKVSKIVTDWLKNTVG